MTRLQALALAAGLLAAVASPAFAEEKASWGYTGDSGPAKWATLDPKFRMCADGKNQSPIDLAGLIEAELTPITFDYKPGTSAILNNGHTIEVTYEPGSTLTVNGRAFELVQFHFHAPSENTINGKQFPMEGHLVHKDKDGHLAVVSVMYNEGAANPALGQLWKSMPQKRGDENPLSDKVSAASVLPKNRAYYRFNGSLTTPPCSEGVWWLVMKSPATASNAQIERFKTTLGFANNRPVQPLNARPVLK